MRIGILTFHRAINYGAVTQCYALATRLQKDFPDDVVEVIDYIPAFREKTYHPTLWRYLFSAVSRKNSTVTNAKIIVSKLLDTCRHPWKFRNHRIRYDTFQKSLKDLPLSGAAYRQNDPESLRKHLAGKYDVLVVGSDCVWKWNTTPLPNAYFWPGDFGAVKVSFAASCGTDDPNLLDEEEKRFLQEALADFSYIGVRDTATEYMVKTASGRTDLHHNCDPTNLLDPATLEEQRESVRRKLRKAGVDPSKPIVGLMCSETLGKLARDIFGDTVQYVAVYEPNSQADVCLQDLSVLEWASAFALFNLTFTSFFHGTMLSLVNHTPVMSFDYLPETDLQITKLHELYNRLDLPGFYHRGKRRYDAEDVKELSVIAHRLISKPPKEQIRQQLEEEAESYRSFYEYLKSVKTGEKP